MSERRKHSLDECFTLLEVTAAQVVRRSLALELDLGAPRAACGLEVRIRRAQPVTGVRMR